MKRNKTTTACEECRTRKKKCDGKRPICEPCREHGRECRWTNFSGRSEKLTKKYIAELETEVERLQQSELHHSIPDQIQLPSPSTLPTTKNTSPLQDQALSMSQSSVPALSQHTSPAEGDINRSTNNISSQAIETIVRPLQSVGSIINSTLSKPRNAFGTASIGNFVSQVVKNVDNGINSTDWVQPFQQDLTSKEMQLGATRLVTPGLGHALPPRETANLLLSAYWQYIHPIFPFVDRIEVEDSFDTLWSRNEHSTDDTVFIYVLNLIFALAARVSSFIDPEQRNDVAKTFVTRAQQAHSLDFWTIGDFQSVQALLLLGLHFHSTDPHYSWMAVSMATRTAQSLGLHLSDTSEKLPTIRARELVRRVWYGCFVMDCIVTQTYGRPSMLSKDTTAVVPLPLPLDEARMSLDTDETIAAKVGSPSMMDAFVQSIKMYEILAEILARFYDTRSKLGRETSTDYENLLVSSSGKTVLSFEHKLAEWLERLPSHLQASETEMSHTIFARQAVILRQRYLQIRILLLRPILRVVVMNRNISRAQMKHHTPQFLHWQLMLQCAVACVETARESIRTIRTHGPSDIREVGNVSTWMHNVLYLYTAATVLLTARICPAILVHVTESSITMSWHDVNSLLKQYEVFGSTAKRVVGILESLNTYVFEKRSRAGSDIGLSEVGNGVDVAPQTDLGSNFNDYGDGMQYPENNNTPEFLTDFFDLSAFDLNDFSWMDESALDV